MISKRNPQPSADDNPMAKQMQQMTKMFPLFILIFGFTLPAGLNVYFLVSSIFRIAQQALIYKLDPTLAPAAGAKTIASREVEPEPKPKPKPKPATPEIKGDGVKDARPKGSPNGAAPNGRTSRKGSKRPSKKKKRR